MQHKIGTRVKKTRGLNNLGATGIVVGHCDWTLFGERLDEVIQVDSGVKCLDRNHELWTCPPGEHIAFASDCWDPIVPDGHKAGDFETVEDLIESLEQENAGVGLESV